jgi:hypothetical protein
LVATTSAATTAWPPNPGSPNPIRYSSPRSDPRGRAVPARTQKPLTKRVREPAARRVDSRA